MAAESNLYERLVDVVGDLDEVDARPGVHWVHVTQPTHEAVSALGTRYGFHHLICDQICDTMQRPQLEENTHSAFIQLKLLRFDLDTIELVPIQVSMVLQGNLLLSFAESDISSLLKPIVDGLRAGAHVRSTGADFLAYQITDLIVDSYLRLLEELAEAVEELEVPCRVPHADDDDDDEDVDKRRRGGRSV